MRTFEISKITIPGQTIRILGNLNPIQMIPPRFSHFQVSFGHGITFQVVGGQWWYTAEMAICDQFGLKLDGNKCYSIEDIIELAPEDIRDSIIWNIDIFRRLE